MYSRGSQPLLILRNASILDHLVRSCLASLPRFSARSGKMSPKSSSANSDTTTCTAPSSSHFPIVQNLQQIRCARARRPLPSRQLLLESEPTRRGISDRHFLRPACTISVAKDAAVGRPARVSFRANTPATFGRSIIVFRNISASGLAFHHIAGASLRCGWG